MGYALDSAIGASHKIWVRKLRGSRRDAALAER
jgi:hypothetical protein